jgi:hypothetical protein
VVRQFPRSPDNQAVTAADYDPFCITVPSDQRLPGGGGNQICGLYDIKPAAFGRVDNVVTQHTHYGKEREVYNGVDVGIEARLDRGARFEAGVSFGRTVTDTCDFNNLPQVLPNFIAGTAVSTTVVTPRTSDFCHIDRPWTSATGFEAGCDLSRCRGTSSSARCISINPEFQSSPAARIRTRRFGRPWPRSRPVPWRRNLHRERRDQHDSRHLGI